MSTIAQSCIANIDFDFECANGKNLRVVAADHAAFDLEVDCKGLRYFAVRLRPTEIAGEVGAAGGLVPAAPLTLDVHADPAFPEHGWRKGPFGRPVWLRNVTDDAWRRLPDRQIAILENNRVLRLHLRAEDFGSDGCGIFVAGSPFVSLKAIAAWANTLTAKHPAQITASVLGPSTEGRPIHRLALRRTDPAAAAAISPAKPKIVIFGAEHGMEYEGVHACQAIAEQALAADCDWLNRVDIDILPAVNPDGLVAGWAQFNAHDRAEIAAGRANPHTEDVSWHHDYRFLDRAVGRQPQPERASSEARQLWDYLRATSPQVLLMFHSWSGKLNQGAFRATESFFRPPMLARLPQFDAAVEQAMLPDPEFVAGLDWQPSTTSPTAWLCAGHVQDYLARDFDTYGAAPEFEAGLPPASHRRCGIKTVAALIPLLTETARLARG